MARHLSDKRQTDAFIATVLKAAEHHAQGMVGPVKTLYAAVIARIDFAADRVEVFERDGQTARTTWLTLKRRRMVFTYNYKEKCIFLREQSLRGQIRAKFYWNEKKGDTEAAFSAALKALGIE